MKRRCGDGEEERDGTERGAFELDLRETQIDTRNKRHNRPPLVSSVQSLGPPAKLDPHVRPSRPSGHTAHPLSSARALGANE